MAEITAADASLVAPMGTCGECGCETYGRYVESIRYMLRAPATCQPCEGKIAAEEDATAQRQWIERIPNTLRDDCGVPPMFTHDTYPARPDAKTRAMLIGRPNGLYITGPVGSLKTHASVAVMWAYLELMTVSRTAGVERAAFPLFVSVFSLLKHVRATFSKRGPDTEDLVIQRYQRAPLLVLDDIGVEKTTEWSLQTLHDIIDHRWSHRRFTVITGNLSLADLEGRLTDRIVSRIVGMCRVIATCGPDRRLT